MRLFTGIDLPTNVSETIERLLETLRPSAHLKWTAVYNLHITTKFIGEWPKERLEEMKSALATVPARAPIPVSVRGLGWKPNPHSPRLFWTGVDAPALADLARDLDSALEKLGVAREQRPFTAHLTLARVKMPVPLEKIRQEIARMDSQDFGAFEATRFWLYLSEAGAAGSVYTKLAEFPFGG